MNRYSPNTAILSIAIAALLSGCTIYLLARPTSFFSVASAMTMPVAGPLPSFLHTLAFALMSALLMTRRNIAIRVIMIWAAIELLAEFAQHPAIPVPDYIYRYQLTSTFDPLDLVAIGVAAITAVSIVNRQHSAHSVTTAHRI